MSDNKLLAKEAFNNIPEVSTEIVDKMLNKELKNLNKK